MARMGRPPIKRKAMTPAERQKRSRQARAAGIGLRAGETLIEIAAREGKSKAALVCIRAIQRQGIPELSGLVGKIGVNLLADLARHTRRDIQRRFVAIFETEGAKAARAYAKARIAARKKRP